MGTWGGRRLHAGRPTRMYRVRVRRSCGHTEWLMVQAPFEVVIALAAEVPCTQCRAALPTTGTWG